MSGHGDAASDVWQCLAEQANLQTLDLGPACFSNASCTMSQH